MYNIFLFRICYIKCAITEHVLMFVCQSDLLNFIIVFMKFDVFLRFYLPYILRLFDLLDSYTYSIFCRRQQSKTSSCVPWRLEQQPSSSCVSGRLEQQSNTSYFSRYANYVTRQTGKNCNFQFYQKECKKKGLQVLILCKSIL